jgi:predicted acetyltransferase
MAITVRTIENEEYETFSRRLSHAFLETPRPEVSWIAVWEQERSIGAFDGDELAGTAGAFSFEMTTPGGSLPTAGVTAVSVKPTHRRRGVLTGMMRQQLEQVRQRGEPLAALWASESIIYGRFGYGLGIESYGLTLRRERADLEFTAATPGRVRLHSLDEARELIPPLWDATRAAQPGMVSRSPAWWNTTLFADPEVLRGGWSERHVGTYERDGELRGYVVYVTKSKRDRTGPDGEVRVDELISLDDEAYSALWRFIFGIDLVGTITAGNRRRDEPLFWMLRDPRRLQRDAEDAIWLRIVDIERALAGRRYSIEGAVTFAVNDDFLPGVAGTYRLEGGPDGAACVRVTAAPDISLSIRELSAALMGSVRFSTLARAGRVEGSAKALRQADLMFSWEPVPWCPEHF